MTYKKKELLILLISIISLVVSYLLVDNLIYNQHPYVRGFEGLLLYLIGGYSYFFAFKISDKK